MKFFFFYIFFYTLNIFASDTIIITATIGEDYKNRTYTGLKSKYLYCKKHGYDFLALDKFLDIERPAPWQKVRLLMDILPHYKQVFWTDADSIFINTDMQLEDIIDFEENKSLHICFDNVSNVVNTGEFLIKNNEDSLQFLNDVWNCEYAIFHGWWENKAFIDLLKTQKYKNFARIYPQRAFNSFGNPDLKNKQNCFYKDGDFLVHFPSIKGDLLKYLMGEYDYLFPCEDEIPFNTIVKFKSKIDEIN